MSTTTTAYEISATNYDATAGTCTAVVTYAAHIDSETAPTWYDDDAVEAHLAAALGGTWTLRGEWDAGDRPTRLEMIATWQRAEAAQ